MRKIERIFVHCTAGPQSQSVDDLKAEFRRKGWKSPGYHYVISPDGGFHQLLPIEQVSNGVRGYNSTAVNIAYIGGVDSHGNPVDNRTVEQKEVLVDALCKLHKIFPSAQILGHRDIWGPDKSKWKKMCPCFDAAAEYKNL